MSGLVQLNKAQLAVVQRSVGHWMGRLQVSPEEFARTFNMDQGMLRSVMYGEGDVMSVQDINTLTSVACSELTEAEKKEIEDYKWQAQYDPTLPRPRTISDVVDELNKEFRG